MLCACFERTEQCGRTGGVTTTVTRNQKLVKVAAGSELVHFMGSSRNFPFKSPNNLLKSGFCFSGLASNGQHWNSCKCCRSQVTFWSLICCYLNIIVSYNTICMLLISLNTMCSFSTATRMEQAYRVEADTFGELQVVADTSSKC